MWNELVKIKNDKEADPAVRNMAALLLDQLNTAGGKEMIKKEVDSFLSEHSPNYLKQ